MAVIALLRDMDTCGYIFHAQSQKSITGTKALEGVLALGGKGRLNEKMMSKWEKWAKSDTFSAELRKYNSLISEAVSGSSCWVSVRGSLDRPPL